MRVKKDDFQVVHVFVQDGSLRTLKVSDMRHVIERSSNTLTVTMKNSEEWEFNYDYKALQAMRK